MAPLLTFYGDDFTGSSAVMEVLSFAGVPTMLFMQPPAPEVLSQYQDLQAIGVAGVARSKDPAWMRAHLPPVFNALKRLDASIFHYKVCSTFDSAPEVGSIGAAIDLGADVFAPKWIPLVVGAPALRRYQAFGHLFAGAGEEIYRIDRHPIMSRHPVTPMGESDLSRHLSNQTDKPVGIVDLATMKAGLADDTIAKLLSDGASILALDVVDEETLAEVGRLIWQGGETPGFAAGSQGVEYALVAHWRTLGILPTRHAPPQLEAVDQIFVASGSCAQTTAEQICYAEARGFRVVVFDPATAVNREALTCEAARVMSVCLGHLSEGYDVLATTSRGPDDPSTARMAESVRTAGISANEANDRLGAALGQLVSDIRLATRLQRAVIGGGDTSGHALTALKAEALSAVAPLAPGAPLCRLHTSAQPALDGLEVTLKGGQMGSPAFFVEAKG